MGPKPAENKQPSAMKAMKKPPGTKPRPKKVPRYIRRWQAWGCDKIEDGEKQPNKT